MTAVAAVDYRRPAGLEKAQGRLSSGTASCPSCFTTSPLGSVVPRQLAERAATTRLVSRRQGRFLAPPPPEPRRRPASAGDSGGYRKTSEVRVEEEEQASDPRADDDGVPPSPEAAIAAQ